MSQEKKLINIPLIIEKSKLVILSPKECWQKIATESTAPSELVRTMVAPLVILGIVLSVVGLQLFGINMGPLGTWRPPLFQHLFSQVGLGIVSIVMLFVSAFIVQKLAGFFQGETTNEKAFSLITHALLPMLVGNLLAVYPLLGIFGLVFMVISVIALYHGASVMTSVAPNKALGFVAAYICIMILASIVIYGLAAFIVPFPQPPLM
jgi:hypothetical protein